MNTTETSTDSFLIDVSWVQTLKTFILSLVIPSGSVIMYSRPQIPSGWALCDGENGTPDLRDKFVVGAGNNYQIDTSGTPTTKTISDPLFISGSTVSIPTGLSYYSLYYIMKT